MPCRLIEKWEGEVCSESWGGRRGGSCLDWGYWVVVVVVVQHEMDEGVVCGSVLCMCFAVILT